MRVEDGAPPGDFPDLVRAHEGIIRRIARSYGGIAEVLGLTVSNVSVRLVRAKEKLKALVGAMERGRAGESWS